MKTGCCLCQSVYETTFQLFWASGFFGVPTPILTVTSLSRAETTPPQQAGAPARVSRQGGGRFGRQLLAPRSGPNQLLHPR